MTSFVYTPITSQYSSVAYLNQNFEAISNTFLSVLPLDGSRSMEGDIDLNGFKILNIGAPVNPTDLVRLQDLETGGVDINDIVPPQSGNSNKFLTTNGSVVSWAVAPATPGAGISQITAGTGLTGGVITTLGTISIANTGVTPGTYGTVSSVPVIQINSQGQVVNATNLTISITKANISDLGTIGTMAAQNTTNYVPKAGGAFTGNISQNTKGVYVYHDNPLLTSGRIIVQAAGPAPSMNNGDILLEY